MSFQQSLANQFLIGLPDLQGDYFQQSLCLLIEHQEDGAFGLMVNRPLALTLADLFQEDGLKDVRVPVLEGGPVQPEQAFFLHRGEESFESTQTLELRGGPVKLSTSKDILESLINRKGPEHLMVMLGYAGWAGGQLETELSENIWLVAPADPITLFDTAYEDRLQEAANVLGVDLSLMSTRPGHG